MARQTVPETHTQKLVHDAAVAIQDIDQHSERAVKAIHDLLRRAGARARGEAAEVDKHDGDTADFAAGRGALSHQALDDLR